jgi:hypothetical protein
MMSGRVTCHWQYWFQTHNKIKKRPGRFDEVRWQMEHTRLLNELRSELLARGLRPHLNRPVRMSLGSNRGTLGGEIDCLVVDGEHVTVYDCKTGEPHTSHQVQVMIYMHALAQEPAFQTKTISGVVVYPEDRAFIPTLPDSFLSHFDHYVGVLLSDTLPPTSPGVDCQFCSVTDEDCCDRRDDLPLGDGG